MFAYNIFKLKKNILMEDLCKDLPNEFYDYMKYVKKLNFESKPDYNYLRNLFRNILYNFDIFSWMGNYSLTLDIYKKNNNSFNKLRVAKRNLLSKKIFSNIKIPPSLKESNYFNTEILDIKSQEKDKNKINKIYDYKEERQFSFSMSNNKKGEERNKNSNKNYFNNININNNNNHMNNTISNLETIKNVVFPKFKFKEYIPRFSKSNNIIFNNNSNDKIRKEINNKNMLMKTNIYNNINKNIHNTSNKCKLNKIVNQNIICSNSAKFNINNIIKINRNSNRSSKSKLNKKNNEKISKIKYLNTENNFSSNLFNRSNFQKNFGILKLKSDILKKYKINIINDKGNFQNNNYQKSLNLISNNYQTESFGKFN